MKTNIIEYITKNTQFKQKDIAKELGVSTAQVSKWKSGESISDKWQLELTKMAGLESEFLEWEMMLPSKKSQEAWLNFFNNFIGNRTANIEDDGLPFVLALEGFGMTLPEMPPSEDESEWGTLCCDYFTKFNILNSWFGANFLDDHGTFDDCLIKAYSIEDYITTLVFNEIYKETPDLVLSLTDKSESELRDFISEQKSELNKEISDYCNLRLQSGMAIKEDYFKLVYSDSEDLADEIYTPALPTINDFLSYSERTLLAESRLQTELLEQINNKLNQSLGIDPMMEILKKLEGHES